MPQFKTKEEYEREAAAQPVVVSEPVAGQQVDIAGIVKAAVEAALAASKTASGGATNIADAITKAFAENSRAIHGIRKITANERKPTSVFNPEGKRGRKLDRVYKVNGHILDPRYLFDRDFELLRRLQEGRFINKRVTATIIEHENPEQTQVLISYPEKTLEDRMENKAIWRDFTGMLQRCLDQQDHQSFKS